MDSSLLRQILIGVVCKYNWCDFHSYKKKVTSKKIWACGISHQETNRNSDKMQNRERKWILFTLEWSKSLVQQRKLGTRSNSQNLRQQKTTETSEEMIGYMRIKVNDSARFS